MRTQSSQSHCASWGEAVSILCAYMWDKLTTTVTNIWDGDPIRVRDGG